TPSSTPGPARLPSPPSVQQKLLMSREKVPQSVRAAVNVEGHKPGTLVSAADAGCVTVSVASANTLSVITMCRKRTCIPSLERPARAQAPRDSALRRRHARPTILIRLVRRSLVNRPEQISLDAPDGQVLPRGAGWSPLVVCGYGNRCHSGLVPDSPLTPQ